MASRAKVKSKTKSKPKTKAKTKSTPKSAVKAKRSTRPAPKAKAKAKTKAKQTTKAKPRSEAPGNRGSVTAYLIVQDADAAIAWYAEVFGASERMRMPVPGNKIGHAEMEIGDTLLMIADEFPEVNARGPKSVGGSPVSLMLYVPDVDDTVARAVAKGAAVMRPVKDQFYGDRSGTIVDPQGHVWHVSTHVEDVSDAELQRRMAEMAEDAADDEDDDDAGEVVLVTA
jgi:PhnB protein